jgi:hypothetical protein
MRDFWKLNSGTLIPSLQKRGRPVNAATLKLNVRWRGFRERTRGVICGFGAWWRS